MKRRAWILIGLLAAIVAVPLALRQQTATTRPAAADDRLVILSPQNESIRQEFGEAFATDWKRKTGRSLYVDWRVPGGTSEIRMVMDSGFKAAAETGRNGIGVDVFFGGGEPDFAGQAKLGRFVPLRVFSTQPNWQVPQKFRGERFYSEDFLWVGTCLSQFGICYNPDFLVRIGVEPPKRWTDLGNPKLIGSLALADPTKSGSIARTFELIVQSRMSSAANRNEGLAAGWKDGLNLIQDMAANSRYFTDSATKPPLDVAQGNAAAGMCIDFYGRSFSETMTKRDGGPRFVWLAPDHGTTLSADPVAVLKGAPHPEIAQAFVEFCLSDAGQKLWFTKLGAPGGPKHHALHRLPIRPEIYTPENLANSTMPDADPYHDPGNMDYRTDYTGGSFNTLRQVVKIMCIDSHEEMTAAWTTLQEAGMPADALRVFHDVSRVSYEIAGHGDHNLDGKNALVAAASAAELGEWFRGHYRQAEALARASKRMPATVIDRRYKP
jgi:iron(III) transport system substrate-binding protein